MSDAAAIPGRGVTLEGRFLPGAAGFLSGVVITHPHPLFGGSMNNNVVWTVERAFHSRGWATLCFNFRGVNRSTGTYGHGEAEVEDVAAALEYLQARTSGPFYLAGYSFGAFVAGRALLQGLAAQGAIFMAPPIAFMDLSFLPRVPGLRLVAAGAFTWRWLAPEILASLPLWTGKVYLGMLCALLPLVSLIGWYGATLTFPRHEEG